MKPHVQQTAEATIVPAPADVTPEEVTMVKQPVSFTTIAPGANARIKTRQTKTWDTLRQSKPVTEKHIHTYNKLVALAVDKFKPSEKAAIDKQRTAVLGAEPYDYDKYDRVILAYACSCGDTLAFDYGTRDEMRVVYKKMKDGK